MTKLTIETFLSSGPDLETNQYEVLRSLKSYQEEFAHSRLYPALGQLIELVSTMESLLQEKSSLQNKLPKHLTGIDLEHRRMIYEPVKTSGENFEQVVELIRWSIPYIKRTIEEGVKIFDFVDENISIEEVGIVPIYKEEGYCFVPENRSSLLHLLRYEVSLYTSGSERFRTLKTRLLKSVAQMAVRHAPAFIKLEMIREYSDLPNPATYALETDLEFPFTETILPIAKRKLMLRVAA